MKKKLLIIIPSTILGLVIIAFIFAKMNNVSPLSWEAHDPINNSEGVALQGYDPVAYFESSTAKMGSGEFKHYWEGAEWHFVSIANMEAFKANPEKYGPQFGGYCAFAVSKGFTAEVDPNHWTINDGKLYVFSNADVLNDWKKDEQTLSKAANNNWN